MQQNFYLFLNIFLFFIFTCVELQAKQSVITDTLEVQRREVKQETINKFKNNSDFQYEQETPAPANSWVVVLLRYILEGISKFFSNQGIFPWLRWSIVIVCLFFLLLKIFNTSFHNLFYGGSKISGNVAHIVINENIMEIDIDDEISKYIKASNFRMAIRYLYLKALKQLSVSELIEWKINKTNYDYYNELHKNKEVQKEFGKLTLKFEYSWYGAFTVSVEHFSEIQKQFSNFFAKKYQK